jgi:hypothetical protein
MIAGTEPRAKIATALFSALLTLVPACKDESYAVVSVVTYSDTVSAVAQFRVHVGNGPDLDTLYYPRQPSESLTLDTSHPITFSVEFPDSRGGQADFEVEALDGSGATLGYGKTDAVIAKGKVFKVPVAIVVGAMRPERGQDGGANTDAGALACDPYVPSAACGSGQTCGLLCAENKPAVGMCYAAGFGKPGDLCAKNDECAPGSQCFAFTAVGCQVMTCLRFCNHEDAACGEQGAFCNVPIQCGSTPPFAACSRPCDPTGTGTLGCAAGLSCFVYANETTDCACAGLGGLGAPCNQSQGCNGEANCYGCAAGLSCVLPTNATMGTCRPICRVAAPTCPTGTTCQAFADPVRQLLGLPQLYGFCE